MGQIYKITNTINGKVYIGKTTKNIEKRWTEHKSDAIKYARSSNENKRPLYDAMIKYGIQNFIIEVIEECPDNELSVAEQKWIKEYHSYVGDPMCNGYNATTGGDGKSYEFSVEQIELLIKLYHQGKTITEISEIIHFDFYTISKKLHELGFDCHQGKRKPIYQLDKKTNEIIAWYESCVDAALKCFNNYRHNGHINDVAAGKRKTAYGYKWCFVEDYDDLYGE